MDFPGEFREINAGCDLPALAVFILKLGVYACICAGLVTFLCFSKFEAHNGAGVVASYIFLRFYVESGTFARKPNASELQCAFLGGTQDTTAAIHFTTNLVIFEL